MKDMQREILNQVAAGTITPEEGAARLDGLEPDRPPPSTTTAPSVREVKIVSRFGSAEVIGDASIVGAVAEGPHSARQQGDALVIEQSPFTEDTSFVFSRSHGRFTLNGFDLDRKLIVRMNPDLALTATVQAGNLRIANVHGQLSGEVQAGNCTVTDFRGPLKLGVAAGNVAATGRLDSGSSSIRCDMGQVKLSLDPASSVRINARSTMGKVDIDGSGVKGSVVGSGAGVLDIDCTMGSVRVSVD